MEFIDKKALNSSEKKALFRLWNREYPSNLAYEKESGLEQYLDSLGQAHHCLVYDQKEIKGWWVDFDREGERWFAMILDESIQGKGLGSVLIQKAKDTNDYLLGWVIDHANYRKRDGSRYRSPKDFYLKNGFSVLEEERLELDFLSAVKIKWHK
ncbi:GNAT family N-acetyltransferase [Persicobacter diffluens]|uniref:N-acetyltransferase domain-containing protein n=1 Tax=Persicobacter diffluens TaxID=981 RepID=A0AAN4VYK9_9BACT|nr:hypothetical protein PEDI_12920 [Persicobacter diffluens]